MKKLFAKTKDGRTYLLTPGEELPYRAVHHKSYITKVMFLCAQARPCMVNGVYWDGKIGIWPIGSMKPAKRSSKNRPAGTMEWHSESVDRKKYRELLITKVLPAIVEKFPSSYLRRPGMRVLLQQDGASAHIATDNKEWLQAVEETRCNIKLYTQSAQSPDLNINNLAFFI